MLSYHNDPVVKAKYQARFEAHRAADEVIQGTGFENGRGCFVGCTLDNYEHSRFPIELGWPQWLAHLADTIFEGVPCSEAAQFGTDLLAAVPVGVDLEPIRYRFLLTVQRRNLARLSGNKKDYAQQCREAIQQVIEYLESPEKIDSAADSAYSAAYSAYSAARSAAYSAADSAADSARSAAYSAAYSARSAAYSAAYSARSAAYSARSAAYSAAYSARSAAYSARSAAYSAAYSARSAAYSAEYQTQRNDLLAMIRELEVA